MKLGRHILTEDWEQPHEVDQWGVMKWYDTGRDYHRVGRPAVIHPSGLMEYYNHGRRIDAIHMGSVKEQIEEIMGEIDFGKILTAMRALSWCYFHTREMTVEILRQTAKECLESAAEYLWTEDGGYCGTGGFMATASKKGLKLEFIVESWNTSYE